MPFMPRGVILFPSFLGLTTPDTPSSIHQSQVSSVGDLGQCENFFSVLARFDLENSVTNNWLNHKPHTRSGDRISRTSRFQASTQSGIIRCARKITMGMIYSKVNAKLFRSKTNILAFCDAVEQQSHSMLRNSLTSTSNESEAYQKKCGSVAWLRCWEPHRK